MTGGEDQRTGMMVVSQGARGWQRRSVSGVTPACFELVLLRNRETAECTAGLRHTQIERVVWVALLPDLFRRALRYPAATTATVCIVAVRSSWTLLLGRGRYAGHRVRVGRRGDGGRCFDIAIGIRR